MSEQDFKAYIRTAPKEERLALLWIRQKLEETIENHASISVFEAQSIIGPALAAVNSLRINEEQRRDALRQELSNDIEELRISVNGNAGTLEKLIKDMEATLKLYQYEIHVLGNHVIDLEGIANLEESKRLIRTEISHHIERNEDGSKIVISMARKKPVHLRCSNCGETHKCGCGETLFDPLEETGEPFDPLKEPVDAKYFKCHSCGSLYRLLKEGLESRLQAFDPNEGSSFPEAP
jgi:hypothetical protein